MIHKPKSGFRLKASLVISSLLLSAVPASAQIHTITGEEGGGLGSNFSMLNGAGLTGGSTDIDGAFDDSLICLSSACNSFGMTLSSAQSFFGFLWTAHAIRVFGPGTYTIDTDCTQQDYEAGRYDCDPSDNRSGTAYPNGDPDVTDATAPADSQEGPDITFTVNPGQLGAHMLFDWLVSKNIHVPVIWDLNQTFTVASDAAFPAIDQTLIYDGSTGDGTGTTILCTDVGVGTSGGVSGSYPQCDTTHTAARIYKFASHDGNATAIVTRYVTDTLTKEVATSVAEPDGLRGFAMVNGPFAGQNANFNLDMTPGYTHPVAVDDADSTVIDTLKQINVLANDTDVEDGAPPAGATVTLLTAASAKGGTLLNNNDGTVNYTPVGLVATDTDTFQYTITDSIGLVSNTATVTFTITAAPNDPPVANAAVFSTSEDVVKAININDPDDTATAIATDANSDPLTFASVVSPTAQGGTVVIEAGSTDITYTPAQDFNGIDTFNFAVNDGLADSAINTMTINVSAVNDAPVCSDVILNAFPNESLIIDKATDLLTGCADVDGDTPVFDSATQPVTAGSSITDGGTTLTYAPATDFEGSDSFTFDVSDGFGGLVTVTATVEVAPPFGNFTMLDGTGNTFGGTNDVLFTWDETFNTDASDATFGKMEIVSVKPQAFFSYFWTAHHIRVYGPGSYSFDTACTAAQYDAGTTACGGSSPMTMTVADGQVGAHILFDWGKETSTTPCGVENCDIDVVNVWNRDAAWDRLGATGTKNALFTGPAGPAPDLATLWVLASTDVNSDGIVGSPMVDGPFVGYYANFNAIAVLPLGTVVGAGEDVVVDPVPHAQADTKLDDSFLASMNALGLFVGLFALISLRRASRNK